MSLVLFKILHSQFRPPVTGILANSLDSDQMLQNLDLRPVRREGGGGVGVCVCVCGGGQTHPTSWAVYLKNTVFH